LDSSTLAKRGTFILFIAIVAFYFYGLGQLPLVGPDEPRYAQVAREMFLRGDLITPTLGGYLWFEKPAFLYWLMIASYKSFGVSEWSSRLGPAVSGILTLVAVFWIGKRTEYARADERLSAVGFWSVFVLATSLGFATFSRAASFDIVVTMPITWALCFFIASETEANMKRRRWLLAGFYIAMGLSLLAKGLVGFVVVLGVVTAYFIVRARAPERIVTTSLIWGLPLSFMVAAAWYLPMVWKHGAPFINQFIIQHHFARYLSDKYHHPGPIYYYLFILILLTLPWTAFLIDGILRVRKWLWRADDSLNKIRVFAMVWILLPLIFFSFSSSKLPGYILPVLPAAALIAGERLARITSGFTENNWVLRATGAVCVTLATAGVIYLSSTGEASLQTSLAVTAPLVFAGGVALLWTRRPVVPLLLIAVAIVVVMLIALHTIAPRFATRESAKQLLLKADEKGYSQTRIFGLQRDDRTPEFYAAGRVTYGPDGEPIMYEGLAQIGNELLKPGGPILVFVPPQDVKLFAGLKQIQTDEIGNNGKVALIAVNQR
jgi:4-amino-4-deoxy-L-arabinose transferase-like glycosyltransferase